MAQYAANQLASHAVLHGELDRAEALLAELPQQIVDPTMTRYQLQLKQGDPDAARATLQKRLYALVQQAAGVLVALPAVLPETQRQLAAAEAYHTLAAAFGLLDSSALLKVEPLLKEGRVPQAAAGAGGVCRCADRAGLHARPGAVRPHPCPPKAAPRRTKTRTCARCGRSCSASWQPTRPLRRCWTTPRARAALERLAQ